MRYIIGDIHGNIEELQKLLALLKPAKSDTLIFLGDYVDKMPHTEKTLTLLEQLNKKYKCIFLKGNHDYVWEQYLIHEDLSRQEFLLKKMLHSYIKLMEKMEHFYLIEDYLALHAGLLPNQYSQEPLVFEERNFFIRPDDIHMKKKYLGTYTLVAGHTYLGEKPTLEEGYINIDLGAGYGKYLCALLVEKRMLVRSDGKEFLL
jgi:serine/threonine protein phosphatase 1